MLKIYSQDHRWAGCIVVVAESEEEARDLMQDYHNYDAATPIEEHEIKKGFVFWNYGDM